MRDEDYREFLYEYPFDGGRWGFSLFAKDREEAEARLRALAWAKLLGPLGVRIPVPKPTRGLAARLAALIGRRG